MAGAVAFIACSWWADTYRRARQRREDPQPARRQSQRRRQHPRAIKLAYAPGPGADSRLTPRGEEHDRPNEASCRVEDYIIDAALAAKEEQPLRSLYPQ